MSNVHLQKAIADQTMLTGLPGDRLIAVIRPVLTSAIWRGWCATIRMLRIRPQYRSKSRFDKGLS